MYSRVDPGTCCNNVCALSPVLPESAVPRGFGVTRAASPCYSRGSVSARPLNLCSYVTVDEDAGRALFYVLVESEGSVQDDPVVLWLNGCVARPHGDVAAWVHESGA
eukprot:365223-Chlamydomonas_euryale.AAC.6